MKYTFICKFKMFYVTKYVIRNKLKWRKNFLYTENKINNKLYYIFGK